MQTIRQSEGGYKLSQEALEIIVVLSGDALLPAEEGKPATEILLNAHNYVWSLNDFYGQDVRLEVCNLLFSLASECAAGHSSAVIAGQEEIANLTGIKPANRKKVN